MVEALESEPAVVYCFDGVALTGHDSVVLY